MENIQIPTAYAAAPTSARAVNAWATDTQPVISEETRVDIRAWRAHSKTFRAYFRGEYDSTGPDDGPLGDYLALLRRVLGHHDLNAAVRSQAEHDYATTLRLLHYRTAVAPKFQELYQAPLKAGFTVLGLKAPDFAQLTRGRAIEQIELFNNLLTGAMHADDGRDLLPAYDAYEILTGLRHLWPRLVPDSWLP